MRKILFLILVSGICLSEGSPITSSSGRSSSFSIETTWDGNPISEDKKIHFTLEAVPKSRDILWRIDAPFCDDPPPVGEPGQPFLGLWDYEVVELFFLNDKDQYLEVEVSPHGQHLVLLLNGERNTVRHSLPLVVETEIKDQRWTANATIPGYYLPPKVTKLNAYTIQGVGEERKYLSLYPTDGTTTAPDVHNLSSFKAFDIVEVNPLHEEYTELSDLWKDALEGIFKYKITRQWNNFRSNIAPTTSSLQGFEGGIEINFTMPINDKLYPAESFVVIFENEAAEAVKFQFFVDGNYFVEFFKNRKNKLDQEGEITLDYRVNNRLSRVVKGSALVSPSFFPPKVTLMNMYSLFGVETMLAMTLRTIEIKSGVDFRPNLSNIGHFSPIDFDLLVESNDEYSPLWRKLLSLPTLMEEGITVENDKTVTTTTVDEITVPEVTSPPNDLGKNMIKEDGVSQDPDEVTERIVMDDTTVDPGFIEGVTLSKSYDDTTPDDSIDGKREESSGTLLFNRPLRLFLKNSRDSQTSSEREISSTKEGEENLSEEILSKDGENFESERNNGEKLELTEGIVDENPEEDATESSLVTEDSSLFDINTEDPSIIIEEDLSVTDVQPEMEIETRSSQIEETATEQPLTTTDEEILVSTDIEVVSEENKNTEESETDSEVITMSSVSEQEYNSENIDSTTISPKEFYTENTTLANYITSDFGESGTLLKRPDEEESQKSIIEKDKVLGQREGHPRRYDENSDKNEIPITFKITFESSEKKKDGNEIIRRPELLLEDSLADDYSILEELTDDLVGVEEVLPPPHPICFTEGLVPDFYRCQVFYECVLENGKWEVYNWRCKRGSYYDPVKVACIRGYC